MTAREPRPVPTPETIRRYGIEPDLTRYHYDENRCTVCGQPVLVVTSHELGRGGRTEMTACVNCMSRLSKRTRAREFRWHFLPGWSGQ